MTYQQMKQAVAKALVQMQFDAEHDQPVGWTLEEAAIRSGVPQEHVRHILRDDFFLSLGPENRIAWNSHQRAAIHAYAARPFDGLYLWQVVMTADAAGESSPPASMKGRT